MIVRLATVKRLGAVELSLHDGVQRIGDEHSGIYDARAFLPRGRGRRPSAAELDQLVADVGTGDLPGNVFVATLAVAEWALARLRELALTANRTMTLQETRQVLLDAVDGCIDWAGEIAINGFARHPNGLSTVTRDQRTGCALGLHVDNWYRRPFSKRSRSPGRLSVNLGAGTRSFLFALTPYQRMWAEILAGRKPERGLTHTDVARMYLVTRWPPFSVAPLDVDHRSVTS